MGNCIMLFEGDKLFYHDRLCEITQLNADGVTVRDGAVSRFIFATDIEKRKFVYQIAFTKDGIPGFETTNDRQKAEKEKRLLESLGWTVKITQTEVK